MTCLAANNAYGTLVVGVDVSSRTLTLSEGEGARFPSPLGDDFFVVTVFSQSNAMEIMYCTARDGDVLTVQRAQEGTTAIAFPVGARVENRFTAGMYSWMLTHVVNALSGKQDILTFDSTPIAGSTNPVTSGGIREAISASIPTSVNYANTAGSAGYANSAGSVGGIGNPMSRDVWAGGVGAIVFGTVLPDSDIPINGTVASVAVSSHYVGDNGDFRTVYDSTSYYGGTWRNIGGVVRKRFSNMTMWQRIA
jgi:hypothetical protein